MINKIIKHISSFFYENNIIDKKDIEVYEYGLELLLTSIFDMLVVIVISLFAGRLFPTLLFLLCFCLLRVFAGGFHASTNFRCFLTLIFVYAIFLIFLNFVNSSIFGLISVIASLVSEILVLAFAPVDSENRRLTEKEAKKYRTKSIIVVSVETLIVFILVISIKNEYIFISVSCGQLAAALSLLAVKIINIRGSKNEIVEKSNND